MFIIGLGFFLTTWILSHRVSNLPTDEEIESKDASNVVGKTYVSQNRFSYSKKAKDFVSKKAEETKANDVQDSHDTSENSLGMVDSNQKEKLLDSLTSQAESQNDEVSKAKEKAAKYDARRTFAADTESELTILVNSG